MTNALLYGSWITSEQVQAQARTGARVVRSSLVLVATADRGVESSTPFTLKKKFFLERDRESALVWGSAHHTMAEADRIQSLCN
jgi:hypothetical protein